MKTEIEAVPQIKLSLYKNEAAWLSYFINKIPADTGIDKSQVKALSELLDESLRMIKL